MIDPFSTARFILVDHDGSEFMIIIKGPSQDFMIRTGDTMTTAGILKANEVKHFDYGSNLSLDWQLTNQFIKTANQIGLIV